MLSSAYAVQGLDNPAWKKFPRYYLEERGLPAEVIGDEIGIRHVIGRLDEIGANLLDIDFYVYGTREPAMTLAFNLAKKGLLKKS